MTGQMHDWMKASVRQNSAQLDFNQNVLSRQFLYICYLLCGGREIGILRPTSGVGGRVTSQRRASNIGIP